MSSSSTNDASVPGRSVEHDGAPIPAPLQPAPLRFKGRGAVGTMAHRFASDVREPADDGWGSAGAPAGNMCAEDASALSHDEAVWWRQAPQALTTQVREEQAHSAIQKNDSPERK